MVIYMPLLNYYDWLTILGFVLFITIHGISKSSTIKNLNTYALGTVSFSLKYLVGTVMATWISGTLFSLNLERGYKGGFYDTIPVMFMSGAIFLIAHVVIPRMKEFFKKLTIAEMLGSHYNSNKIRIFVASLGILNSCAPIAIQFYIMGKITAYFIPDIFGTKTTEILIIILGAVVTLYTLVGGVNSVIRTDLIQLGIGIVSIIGLYYLLYNIQWQAVDSSLPQYKHYDLSYVLTTYDDNFWAMISLVIYFIIPAVNPASYQRIVIASSIKEAQKTWYISALGVFIISLIISYAGYILFCIKQGLDTESLLSFLINEITPSGMKGLLLIGFLALAMSTADSFLNVLSVMFANDLCIYFNINIKQKLNIARYATLIGGVISIIIALQTQGMMNTLLIANSFYMPVITVLFFVTIFKFNLSSRCVLFSLYITTLAILLIKIFCKINPLIPGLIFSGLMLISSYYIVEKWELLKCFGIRSKLKEK
ncbi:MAG: sodium:solute symporter family protein [Alphaproteobacteria bacterium]|nr:sodium:solute symporter family protein [Alphaproteobacteria bacterium]